MVAVLPFITAAVGIGSATGAFGGGSNTPTSNLPAADYYQPTWQSGEDNAFQTDIQNLQTANPYDANLAQQAQNVGQGYINDPFAAGAQSASGAAGAQSGALGTQLSNLSTSGNSQLQALMAAIQGGNPAISDYINGAYQGGAALQDVGGLDLSNAGSIQGQTSSMAQPVQSYAGMTAQQLPQIASQTTSSLLPTAMQTYGTQMGAADTALYAAFDPLNAQYNQQYQQNTDATGANLAAAGIGTSGTGVGILDSSQQNFNNQWTNQQQGREQAGLSAYDTAANSALGNLNTAASTTNSALSGALNSGVNNLNTGAQTGITAAIDSAGLANTLGTAGGQNILTGSAAPYNAYQANVTNDLSNLSTAANVGTAYGNIGAGGVNATNVAGQLPYNTSTNILSNQNTGITDIIAAAQSGQNLTQQQIGDLLTYMGYGQTAASGYSTGQQQGQQTTAAQMQAIGNIFGSNGIFGNTFTSTAPTDAGASSANEVYT